MLKEKTKVFGLIILICGIILLIWGVNLHISFKNQLLKAADSPPTTATLLVLAGGTFCTGLGTYKLAKI